MSQCTVQYVNIPASIADLDGSKTFGRIRIRSGTEINVSDPDSNRNPKLDPKKICKKKPCFQAVLGIFILFTYLHLQAVVRSLVDLWHFGTDPDPRIRASHGAEWRQSFYVWRWGWVKMLVKKYKFWPVSDQDPNPGFGSGFVSRSETNFRPDTKPESQKRQQKQEHQQ
jgi:hypothetical protein